MYGAAIGDIVGSKYEFDNIHTKEFPFVSADSDFTDDTVMTVAVAKALMQARAEQKPFQPLLVQAMQDFGRRYPGRGYGGRFGAWLYESDPKPYNSYGNGAAMRVSPCGLIAVTMEEALALAGIDALEAFIREIGLPRTLRELGVDETLDLRAVAASCCTSPGAFREIGTEEMYEIYRECF